MTTVPAEAAQTGSGVQLHSSEPFPTAFDGRYQGTVTQPKTLLERALDQVTGAIRNKVDWPRKLRDPKIVEKWASEIVGSSVSLVGSTTNNVDVTQEHFDFAIKQLQFYARCCSEERGLMMSAVFGAYHSDTALTPDLRTALLTAIAPMENVPEAQKDWHPGSNRQVLDLVHPSLYPLIYGVSRVVPRTPETETFAAWKKQMNRGTVIQVPAEPASTGDDRRRRRALGDRPYESKNYQWLPAEVSIDAATGATTFESYVNNLHPERHADMYAALRNLLRASIPLFDRVLAHSRVVWPHVIEVDMYRLYGSEPSFNDDDDWEEWYENRMPEPVPLPLHYEAPPLPDFSFTLRGRRVQVIVKLAEIVLTEDNPEYPGGTWHLEGMANERIVATAIAYLECNNITPSHLHFRRMTDEPYYEQNDNRGVAAVYGLHDEDPLNEAAGSIACEEGRLIAFPNTLQHRVAPFKIADASKGPGLRKIAVFFLVDPNTPITSTRDVPPQQAAWHELEANIAQRFPEEIVSNICSRVEFPIFWESACKHREELMAERSALRGSAEEDMFEYEFSLCEH